MTPKIDFNGHFQPSPRMNVVPGAWYLGFQCAACSKPIAILDDPTGSGMVETGGVGDFEVQCPYCGEARGYSASALHPWQATTGSPSGLD